MARKLKTLLSSIAFKFGVALVGLSAMIGAAVVVSNVAFDGIQTRFTALLDTQVADLQNGASVIARAGELKDGLTEVLIAENGDALATAVSGVDATVAATNDLLLTLPPEQAGVFLTRLEDVRAGLSRLGDARAEEYRIQAAIQTTAGALETAATDAVRILLYFADEAAFDLEIGASEKVDQLDETLTNLVERDFEAVQTLYKIRAEINLLSGTLIAANETRDVGLQSIMHDLSRSALRRIAVLLPEGDVAGVPPKTRETIDAATGFFEAALVSDRLGLRRFRDTALSHRQEVENRLAEAIDDQLFSLVMNAETASEGNRKAIEGLLENQLGDLRQVTAMDETIKDFQIYAFQAAVALDDAALASAQDHLSAVANRLAGMLDTASEDLQPLITSMLPAADPETGIISIRRDQLAARVAANEISRSATENVVAIANLAREAGNATVTDIANAGQAIGAQIAGAHGKMRMIAATSAALVLATLAFAYLFLVRPLLAVTRATERLASGDHATMARVPLATGEVGRMVTALRVFRDNLIETERMQEDDIVRRRAEVEAEKRAAEQSRERDEKERALRREQEEERAAMKAAQDAERVQTRRATEAERRETEEAQKVVVTALADALEGLAAGALDTRITRSFPEAYDQLRVNFNDAMQALERTIIAVFGNGQTILGNAAEISGAAEDLSRRTEASATTLAETATALDQLTAVVRQAAAGASQAEDIVNSTREEARNNEAVVKETIAAMAEIEKSSQSIAKIVDVIEDIAFQTNLLALNAGVEAARAGESGRGFAVVASEVRLLAQRSAEAAQEIGGLIRDSGEHVQRGVGLVDKTGAALEGILHSVTDISDVMARIAASTSEQSSGIGEINRSVEQLDRVTQQNAAMFEETTAATHSLTSEARDLAGLLQAFRVSGRDDTDAPHAAAPAREARLRA